MTRSSARCLPNEFVPVAEDTGLILPLGRQVLAMACAEAARWQERWPGLRISVNLSARQLFSRDVVDMTARCLTSSGLRAGLLAVEITESVVMRDAEHVFTVLRGLRELGVRIALDDFGTGYSSLSYLNRFPVDALKIDRSFVAGLPDDANACAIVAAVMAVTRALQLQVVAEGVELGAQTKALAELRCEMAQGFLFSKPVPPERFLETMETLRAAAVT